MTHLHQPGQAVFRAILPEDIEWKLFPAFPPTARLAVIVGEPSKPGPYVIRVKAPPGVTLMPHRHPEDRIYTVVSAVFYICLGGRFDGDKVKACPPGSVNDRRAKRRRDPRGRSGASGRVQTVTQLIPETRHPSTRSSDDRLRPHQLSGERKYRSVPEGASNDSNRPLAPLQDGPMDGRYAPDCGRTRNTTPVIRRWLSAKPIPCRNGQSQSWTLCRIRATI